MTRITSYFKSLLLIELLQGLGLTLKYLVKPKYTLMYPMEKTPQSPSFRAIHALRRLQAGRSGLPGAGDHHRFREASRRYPPYHALRHRPVQVHLLRLLRGILPGRLDRGDAYPRIPLRQARPEHRHQAAAAGDR